MKWPSFVVFAILLFGENILHIYICPYTKVEESFNMQAIHDMLFLGAQLDKYDHHTFPGVVPRTFVGALSVYLASLMPHSVISLLGFSKFYSQLMVRITLGSLNTLSLLALGAAIRRRFGKSVMQRFFAITASQFHLLFYISRTLPNSMALILVCLSFSCWLTSRKKLFIALSGFSILVFRSELILFYGPCLLFGLIQGVFQIRLWLFLTMLQSVVATLAISIPIDSIFWRRWLWPEGEVFYYNAILNKSSQWGTSPFHWYFSSALPRALLTTSFLFILWPFYVTRSIVTWKKKAAKKIHQNPLFKLSSIDLILSGLLFVLIYSVLPHKELRFIIYVVPLFNLASAVVWTQIEAPVNIVEDESSLQLKCSGQSKFLHQISVLFCYAHLLLNLALTILLSSVSAKNYPGGEALNRLNNLPNLMNNSNVRVHICNLAAQTGVTRFLEVHDKWTYDKTEHIEHNPTLLERAGYTHIISELDPEQMATSSQLYTSLFTVDAYSGIEVNLTWKLWLLLQIKTSPKLTVYERTPYLLDSLS